MCYDIKASLEAQLNRARRKGDENAIREILEKLVPITDLPLYHVTGFQHPKLLIYTDRSPIIPEVAKWGLVPHWVKNREQLTKFWNNTLNARGETIFEKPAFRDSARHSKCLIFVDGFYEHHHFKGKTYPFYIFKKNGKPLCLAGLYSEWIDRETGELLNTFSIVTTEGNELLTTIHNNPKIKGPRMPLILPTELEDNWLREVTDELDEQLIEDLISPYPDGQLKAYTVKRLRGHDYVGNFDEASQPFSYEELNMPL